MFDDGDGLGDGLGEYDGTGLGSLPLSSTSRSSGPPDQGVSTRAGIVRTHAARTHTTTRAAVAILAMIRHGDRGACASLRSLPLTQ